jgi:hypothetical protein
MSPPPTSIDGTDITGATIDGQEVQEITVDGQTVFKATNLPQGTVTITGVNETQSQTSRRGVEIEPFEDYEAIGFGLSSAASGLTEVYVFNPVTSSVVHSQSISSVSPGDAFRINFDFTSGQKWIIVGDANGSSYTEARLDSSLPETDPSVNIDITSGVFNESNTGTGSVRNFDTVGKRGL